VRGQPGFQIIVADNGTGVARDIRSDLFKRATSTKGSIGMGLILVRQLLHLIQADLQLQATSDSGSEFVIKLPERSA
jgi:signal transduction histidine kinase